METYVLLVLQTMGSIVYLDHDNGYNELSLPTVADLILFLSLGNVCTLTELSDFLLTPQQSVER
jgi:hypothetical protein